MHLMRRINVVISVLVAFLSFNAHSQGLRIASLDGKTIGGPFFSANEPSSGWSLVTFAADGQASDFARADFMDAKGNYLSKDSYKWSAASSFSEGLAAVLDFGPEGLYGYVAADGIMAIPYRYASAGSFSGGYASVQEEDGSWGIIDKKGAWALKPGTDPILELRDGLAVIRDQEQASR